MRVDRGKRWRHAILPAIGTGGDVYPFIALGAELRARGCRVTIATHEHYAEEVRAHGLDFVSLVSNAETETLLQQRDFWHPYKGPIVVARWGATLVERNYEVLAKLASEDGAFLVSSVGVVAARVVQEKLGTPLVSVILQPWLIPSRHAPPVMMGGLTLPRWAPKPLGKLYVRMFHQIGGWLAGRELKRLRASLGLATIRRFFDWWHSPQLLLGLFPEWYGPPQPDWPPQMCLTGFPLGDGRPAAEISAETLTFCQGGEGPIVFTFGTGMLHAEDLFRLGIGACEALGQRGILLTKYRDQLPRELPAFMHHSPFEPFEALFPQCAAVVHHGGVGTVAKALAAGTPQLILPFAFDQLDNAVRVQRLGAGSFMNRGGRSQAKFTRKLAEVLVESFTFSAEKVKMHFTGKDNIVASVDRIEEVVSITLKT